ncbi:protein RTF1 homolog [Macadamia integrifolia]|uniref:protein RTF1 homolog n=1 Tax=Macadamia integrifolia TaxID=60698 RepID=UPI001C52CADA|nr:protein RTF1 homolog [Macadamia integrifolia]XP_042520615.1 protein RTF1 homolog [Macadamia integrifolia]XP_042520616.1 protein RTF1 homolog [Macadamia integrifolia]XP_042520617.1 protein RTF1 homolog [Macadamia integrifolia]
MADLENLLLEAAGRTGGSGGNRRPPSRRRREGSYSDDGSDSKDDDSDDDLGYKSRKPSGSQVPLKKRLDPIEKDDDRDSQGDDDDSADEHRGGSSDESDVGSDLYKGDEDRENLAQMTELEREYILSERATRRDDLKLKETVRAKQSGKKSESVKETTPPPRLRSSARSADRAAAKDDALNELRLKRKKQQDPEGHWRSKDVARGGSSGRGSPPVKRRGILTASPSSSSQSESQSGSHSRDDGSTGDGDLGDSDDDRDDGRDRPVFEDVKNITIRRSKLAKWLMEPFFEELIVGCFVRVGIGMSRSGKSIYRLCIVRNVDATDPNRQYKLENKTTYKYLNCVWGNESSAARWQMARVSDAAPLLEEFNEWVREVERNGGRMPTCQAVLEKREAIQKTTNTFVYSAATVKQMLQEKKSASSRPMNIAAEKQRLRREMDVAESRRDEAELERLRARLKELEAMSRQVKEKDSKAVRLSEMNKKNRAENFKNASELKPVNTSLKAGEAGYDPFSRRWTRSMNYYVSKPGGADETAASANGDAVSAGTGSRGNNNGVERARAAAGFAATVAALEAAADAGKLVDTNAPVDQGTESNSLHNFELPISLAGLQKFGGPHGAHAGFLGRKQRIEATVGCRVPENDGRRHALTLTVSDYKRRRGLL